MVMVAWGRKNTAYQVVLPVICSARALEMQKTARKAMKLRRCMFRGEAGLGWVGSMCQ